MTPRKPAPPSGPVAGQVIALAKAELKQEALKAGRPWGMLGGAGFAGYMVLLFASFAAWWGFAEVMAPGWAALIVTAIWAVIGAVLYTQGRRRLREVNLKPERTGKTIGEMQDAASAVAGQVRDQA
jgi:peptidoglycan/LPS O-acetylase OafA/YrhL